MFKSLEEVRVSECQMANDTKGKGSTTPRETRSYGQSEQEAPDILWEAWRRVRANMEPIFEADFQGSSFGF